jgi:hypothetical protein
MSRIAIAKDGSLKLEPDTYQVLGQGNEPIVFSDAANDLWVVDPKKGQMRRIETIEPKPK